MKQLKKWKIWSTSLLDTQAAIRLPYSAISSWRWMAPGSLHNGSPQHNITTQDCLKEALCILQLATIMTLPTLMKPYSRNKQHQRLNKAHKFGVKILMIKICSMEATGLCLVVQSFELPFHSWASNEASSLLLKKSMLLCSPAISSLKDRRRVLMHQEPSHNMWPAGDSVLLRLKRWQRNTLRNTTWLYGCHTSVWL